eukprot:708322-Prorocentrum_minimum.AAC.1
MLRAILWTLRAILRTLRAIPWTLRAIMRTLRAILLRLLHMCWGVRTDRFDPTAAIPPRSPQSGWTNRAGSAGSAVAWRGAFGSGPSARADLGRQRYGGTRVCPGSRQGSWPRPPAPPVTAGVRGAAAARARRGV